eukprot:TRINITY_DN778_c0_g1_i1.p1 TRINITY_DN778_c0_g1~~TRINITY_DN778_c0_g1_i1.p1  ORF type:complete len:648 (+),score=129.14 TRINITY_DN778_c0_g1_i1:343-2286(+)
MPSKMHSFTRFLRSESSHFRRKVMAKLLRDENVPSQLRNIASVLNDPYPVFRFLQVFLLGVFIAMTVMALFWSSKHAHHSVASLSDNLEDSWISILESTDVSAVHLADLLSSNVSRGDRASPTNDVASAQVSVGVILHNGIWGHIAISTAIILSICRLARAAKKVMQLCAALLQQRQARKRAESMNNHKSSDTHEIVLCNELRCSPLLAKGDQDAVSEMTEKNQRIRDQKPLFEELGADIECIEKRVYAICLVSEHPQNTVWRNQGNDLSKEMLSSCILSRDCEENGLVDKARKQKEEGEGKTIVLPTKTNAAGVGEASYVSDTQAHLSIASTNTFVAVEHVIGHSSASSNGPQKEEVDGSRIKAAYHGFLAREALRALDRLAKLKLSGQLEPVQKEAATAPHCVQALARVQAPARACCASAVDYQDRFDHKTYVQKLEAGWCDKLGSVDAIQKEERRRQETAPTHEKAKSSAFAHQWKPHSRINYRQSGRRKSDGTNKGCNWLGCGMATYSWKTKGHLDAAKMDGSESISSNILDPLMDGTSMHSNYKMTCGRGRRSSGGYEKECSIRRDSRSKRSNSIASHQKARVNQQGSSIQLKPNQGGKGRKSALGRTQNRSTKSKQTKSCDQTHAGIAAVGGSSKNLCNYF